MKAVLVLGCEGRTEHGFHFCRGVENVVLDLEPIRAREDFKQLIEYLDRVPKIFDAPCCKSSIITNAIYKIYDMGFINQELYDKIGFFYKQHLYCGMVLRVRAKI